MQKLFFRARAYDYACAARATPLPVSRSSMQDPAQERRYRSDPAPSQPAEQPLHQPPTSAIAPYLSRRPYPGDVKYEQITSRRVLTELQKLADRKFPCLPRYAER